MRACRVTGSTGIAAFFVGAWHLYEAVFQCRFFGPIKPQDLVERPEYLADDAAFERASLPALSAAFEANLAAATAQAYRIHRAGRLVGAAVILLAVTIVCYAATSVHVREKGTTMAKKQHRAGDREIQANLESPDRSVGDSSGRVPSSESVPSSLATSPFRPYIIWRGGGDTPKPVRK